MKVETLWDYAQVGRCLPDMTDFWPIIDENVKAPQNRV